MKKNSFFKEHIRNNSVKYILCIILLLAGTCVGCSRHSTLSADNAQSLVTYFSESAVDGAAATFTEVFKNCLISNLKYTVAYFVLSMTAYSAWCCVAVPAVKGFAAGFTSAFLIANYAAHGVAYVLLAILPSCLLILPMHFFAAVVCINFAADRRKRRDIGARAAMGIVPALAIIFAVMAVCSLYDALISPFIFKNLF
ncbi:MAG: stage II sporulation protein M [Clostridia bacterium]|nr:stage II sporulation protein M [Clostridia bacterium]